MAQIFQVGVGSGGMAVLDMVCRDPAVHRVVIIDPDVLAPHNLIRHLFGPEWLGRLKIEGAAAWIRARRPDIEVHAVAADITDAAAQAAVLDAARGSTVGICAADNEAAKYAFDALMRQTGCLWTMGEVLSGGIGGWVHRFTPTGPCYGCVASYLRREVCEVPPTPPPDYSHPQAAQVEMTIPASYAAIHSIASLHALLTLECLQSSQVPASVSVLVALQQVDGVFPEAWRFYRYTIPRSPACLMCSLSPTTLTGDDLDVALAERLARLATP